MKTDMEVCKYDLRVKGWLLAVFSIRPANHELTYTWDTLLRQHADWGTSGTNDTSYLEKECYNS